MSLSNTFKINDYKKEKIEKLLQTKIKGELFSCAKFNEFLNQYEKELDSINPESLKKIYQETGIKIKRKMIANHSLFQIDKDALEIKTETINFSKYSRFQSNIMSEIEKQMNFKQKVIEKKDALNQNIKKYKDRKLEYFEKIEKIDQYIEELNQSIQEYDICFTTRVDDIKIKRNKLGLLETIMVKKDGKEYFLNPSDILNHDEFDGKYPHILEIIDGHYVVNTLTKEKAPMVEYTAHTDIDAVYGLEGKWGLVDIHGRAIIKPKYIYPFIECGDYLQVMLPETIKNNRITTLKHGLIDKKGKIIIPIKYIYMESMDNSGTYFRVVDPKTYKSGVLDKNNHIIIPFDYEYVQAVPDLDLCTQTKYASVYPDHIYQVKVCNHDLYGIYDLTLKKEIIKPKYKYIRILDYNKFLVGEDYGSCYTLINEKEEVIMK